MFWDWALHPSCEKIAQWLWHCHTGCSATAVGQTPFSVLNEWGWVLGRMCAEHWLNFPQWALVGVFGRKKEQFPTLNVLFENELCLCRGENSGSNSDCSLMMMYFSCEVPLLVLSVICLILMERRNGKNWILNQRILTKTTTWVAEGEYGGVYVSYKHLKNDTAYVPQHIILFYLPWFQTVDNSDCVYNMFVCI